MMRRIRATYIGTGFLAAALLFAVPASADEIVADADPGAVAEYEQAADEAAIGAVPADDTGVMVDDSAGLFVETGEDTVTRNGETLDEAREEDDPMSGSGDGGSTVNIGHLYEINGVLVRNSDFPSEVN